MSNYVLDVTHSHHWIIKFCSNPSLFVWRGEPIRRELFNNYLCAFFNIIVHSDPFVREWFIQWKLSTTYTFIKNINLFNTEKKRILNQSSRSSKIPQEEIKVQRIDWVFPCKITFFVVLITVGNIQKIWLADFEQAHLQHKHSH